MLARRIIAVSPDKAFGKKLSVALMAAGGTVDWHANPDELGKGNLAAALLVVHVAEVADVAMAANLVSRLTNDGKAIVIIPASNLANVVEVMQGSDRVAGMLAADDLDTRTLSAMATRVMAGDIFGLDKLIRWGTQIHSHLVGDYQEKSLCISQISEFAEAMGVRRKYRESIEQCMDEMLMNALYDAPVDEHGKQIFAEVPTKTRISLRVEQKVVVQYACDGKQFAVSVRDTFGTLERPTVLRYLHKCLHSDQQIDRKAGGAGLGLYLMTNSSSEVYFNVLPGVATEAVCIFDLETPKLQLESFGFFHERIDAAGRLAGGPSRRLPAGAGFPVERRAGARGSAPSGAPPISKSVIALLVAMIAVVLGLIGAVAYPRLSGGSAKTTVEVITDPKGATIELEGKNVGTATDTLIVRDLEVGRAYPIVARLEGYETKTSVVQPAKGGSQITLRLAALAPTVRLESTPSGATVTLEGKELGVTPLDLTTLPPNTVVKVTFTKAGFHPATASLDVPGPGKDTRLVQPLAVSDDLARIKLISDPAGAQVIQNGQMVAGATTPTEVLVEAGKPQRFTLTMAKKVPYTFEPFTPGRGADDIVKSATLLDGHLINVVVNIDAKVTISGAAHCQAAAATPYDCLVGAGKYTVDLVGGPGVRAQRKIAVTDADVVVKFEFGTVVAGEGKKIQMPGLPPGARAVLEVGPHKVTVIDEEGTHQAAVIVKPGATVIAN